MNPEIYHVYLASCHREGGIYHYHIHRDGRMEEIAFTPMDRPMYMVLSEGKMYILLRDPWNRAESALVSYELDEEGRLGNPSCLLPVLGQEACHLLADGGEVYCACYHSGSVIKMPDTLIQHQGSGPNPDRQEMAHPHFVGLTPDGEYVCVADLGTETIYLYDRGMNLRSRVSSPSGHGVRHLAFSEDGKYLFAVNELISSVSVYAYRAGELKLLETQSCVPEEFSGETYAGAIRVRGNDVYVSNRGHDSIARMTFENQKLRLADWFPCGGSFPRDFQLAGNYLICANQLGNSVTVFALSENNREVARLPMRAPLCVCVSGGE